MRRPPPAGKGALLGELPAGGRELFSFSSPAIVRPFPRRKAALYSALCLLWLVFGVFGRDPWKPEETILVALIAEQLASGAWFAAPALAGMPHLENPPLYLWLAAVPARLLAGVLPLHEAARLVNMALLLGGFALLWLAGRRAFGSRVAWLATLLLVGAAGFVVRAHLLNYGVPAFFGGALALYAAAVLQSEPRRPAPTIFGGALAAAAALFLAFAVGWLAMAAMLFALCWWKSPRLHPLTAVCLWLLAAAAAAAAWLFLAAQGHTPAAAVAEKWGGVGAAAAATRLLDAARVAGWSLLPLSLLAVVGVWKERRQLPPLSGYAAAAAVCALALFLAAGHNEEDLFMALPPLALMAARALRKAGVDLARWFDAFGLLVIGALGCLSFWLAWAALHFGQPPALAAWLAGEFPGFAAPPPHWGATAFALALTLGWLALASNFGRSNERAAVNWGAGVVLLWALANLLFGGYIDSGKSFRPAAVAVAKRAAGGCVEVRANIHWRAQLLYFGAKTGGAACPYAFVAAPAPAGAAVLWEGGRGGRGGYALIRQ